MPVSRQSHDTRDNSNSRDLALPSHVQLEALPPVFNTQSNVLGGRAAKCPCHGRAMTRDSCLILVTGLQPSHVQLEALPPVLTMQSNVLGGRAAKCPCHGRAMTRESIIEYSNYRDES